MKRKRIWALCTAIATIIAAAGWGSPPGPASAASPELPFTGAPGEWDAVPHDSASVGNGLLELKAVQADGKLRMYVKGANAGNGTIYIDSDNDAATGYAAEMWTNGGGVDYRIRDGRLAVYDGGSWTDSGEVAFASAETMAEYELELSALGLAESRPLKVGYADEAPHVLPEIGDPMLTVAAAASGGSHGIVVDGDPADWSAVAPLAVSEGGATTVKAYADDSNLYVLIEGQIDANEFDDGIWEHILIDTDGNPATGASSWAWAGTLGSEYLVQFGQLYASGADGGWAWNDTGETFPYARAGTGADKRIEWSVPLAAMGLENTASVRLGFLSNTQAAPAPAGEPAVLTLRDAGAGVVIDGEDEDWSDVAAGAVRSGAQTTLRAVQDDRKLYTLVQGENLDLRNVYYLDSDHDASTGETDGAWPGAGIDYKIDRGNLYRYEPDGSWTRTGPVHIHATAEASVMYLYLDQIGRSGPGPMRIAYEGRAGLRVPGAGLEMLTLSQTIPHPSSAGVYYPRESFDVLNNPYMGWAPWAKDKDKPAGEPYAQPHSLVYAGVSWRELEPVRGEFAWEAVEEKYQFDYWAGQGKRINLRIVLDLPTDDPAHMDIPDWLYELLSEDGPPGTWYDTAEIGAGFSPDYNNPALLAEHERLIAAVADRYDEDDRIAFIQLGSLGHWGEWHTWPAGSGVFPLLSVSDQYVRHYLDHFTHKKIGMRKPFPIARANDLGLFNDVFGIKSSTNEFIGWTINGWTGIGEFVDPGDDPAAKLEASKMPDFWQRSFSGGEFAEGNPLKWLADDTVMESLRQARESHTSWLGPAAPADAPADSPLQANLDAMLKTMGYRFVLEAVEHAGRVAAGSELDVSMSWHNKGVAPFYFDWPLELALADAEGRVAAAGVAGQVDLRAWLPGRTRADASLAVPADLPAGTYTLLVAALDPATGEPGIRLAIDGRRTDGRYALGAVIVESGGDTAGGDGSTGGASGGNAGGAAFRDGVIYAALASERVEDGVKRTRYEVDEAVFGQALDAAEPEGVVVRIGMGEGEAAEVAFRGSSILSAQERGDVVLAVTSGLSSYRLPVGALDLGAIAAELEADAEDVSIVVTMEQVAGEQAEAIANAAAGYGLALAGDPVGFAVRAEAGGRSVEIADYGRTYVTRTVSVPESGEDAVYTAVRYDPDTGGLYFAPAAFSEADGVVQAAIRRNGNSVYAVLRGSRTYPALASHWAREAIESLASRLLLRDRAADAPAPAERMTRASFATLLAQALGLSPDAGAVRFDDVRPEGESAGFVGAAVRAGLLAGRGDGTFDPDGPLTREQAAALLDRAWRFLGLSGATDDDEHPLARFADGEETSGWAQEAVANAVSRGLLQGDADGRLRPRQKLTMAEAAVLMHRFLLAARLTDR